MFAEFDFDNFLLGVAFTFALGSLILPSRVFERSQPTQRKVYFWLSVMIILFLVNAFRSFGEHDGVSMLTHLLLVTSVLVALLREKRWFPY